MNKNKQSPTLQKGRKQIAHLSQFLVGDLRQVQQRLHKIDIKIDKEIDL